MVYKNLPRMDAAKRCWMQGRRCEKEGRSAGEDMRGVRPAVRLAQEMGALLGRGALLLGALPASALGGRCGGQPGGCRGCGGAAALAGLC
jgi:hypothetical protein